MAETNEKYYSIFIASPSDVEKERKAAKEIISQVSRILEKTVHVGLRVESWQMVPPLRNKDGIQVSLNELVRGCDFLLLILNKKYGTIEPGYDKSNTEREIDAFLENEDKGSHLLSYFKILPENYDQGVQEKRSRELRKKLNEKGVLSINYKNTEEFKERFQNHLYEIILKEEIAYSDNKYEKKERLQSFWRLGISSNEKCPEISIIYPPVRRKWMAADDDHNFWYKRLQPHVFFEDFKAISKIAKMLNLLHIKMEVSPYMTFSGSINDAKNIVWVCLPRIPRVKKRLEKEYSDVTRFKIVSRKKDHEACIKWKTTNGNEIVIKSPLQTYLSIQRENVNSNEEWNTSLRNVIAKDYAVIARFNKRIPENEGTVNGEKFKEFFIGGIHGLGTWGATHYLDRNYKNFFFGPNDEIQMLLEITYEDGHITDCKDVSDKEQAYFNKSCTMATIRKTISESR